ncbi:hypothetical protein HYDPIDRAFT_145509, partial [Hydnomerulius pinastri MD-312]
SVSFTSLPSRATAATCRTLISGPRHSSPRFPHTTTTTISAHIRNIFAQALDTKSRQQETLTPAQIWAQRSANLNLPPPPDTWSGRRIPVENGNLNYALIKLGRRLKSNNVYRELRLASRHEKKGDKRARLSSERWRKRFADEVRKKIQLVSTIRRRRG